MGEGLAEHAIADRISTECEVLTLELRRLILDVGSVISRFNLMIREADTFASAAFAGAAFGEDLAQQFRDDVGATEVCQLVCILQSAYEVGSEVTDDQLVVTRETILSATAFSMAALRPGTSSLR